MDRSATMFDQLSELLGTAHTDVVIVAPFIKEQALKHLLASVREDVKRIRIVTRWKIAEIAAGVSDPQIVELIRQDRRISIDLCHRLHAKVFIADQLALAGSANVTATALGFTDSANVEILIPVAADHWAIVAALASIDPLCTPASAELARLLQEQADLLARAPTEQETGDDRWLPTTRAPERLFPVYGGTDLALPQAVLGGVVQDLAALDIPPGLSEDKFNDIVRERLRLLPELRDLAGDGGMTGPALERSISDRLALSPERAQSAAQRLAAWVTYFDDYMLTPGGYWEIQRGTLL